MTSEIIKGYFKKLGVGISLLKFFGPPPPECQIFAEYPPSEEKFAVCPIPIFFRDYITKCNIAVIPNIWLVCTCILILQEMAVSL